jgi:hypothetical protein
MAVQVIVLVVPQLFSEVRSFKEQVRHFLLTSLPVPFVFVSE